MQVQRSPQTQPDDHAQSESIADLRRFVRRRMRLLTAGVLGLTLIVNVAPVAANHLSVKTSDTRSPRRGHHWT